MGCGRRSVFQLAQGSGDEGGVRLLCAAHEACVVIAGPYFPAREGTAARPQKECSKASLRSTAGLAAAPESQSRQTRALPPRPPPTLAPCVPLEAAAGTVSVEMRRPQLAHTSMTQ